MPGTRKHTRMLFAWAAAAVICCLAAEVYWFGLTQLDWSVPMLYGGDGVSGVQGVKEMLHGEGLLGWPLYEASNGTDPNYNQV